MLSASAASWGEFCTIPFDTAKVRHAELHCPPLCAALSPELTYVHPLCAVVQVRLQMQDKANPQYRGLFHTLSSMVKQEGFTTPWKGVTAGIQRQCAFAPIRIGLYEPVRNFYVSVENRSTSSTQRAVPTARTCLCPRPHRILALLLLFFVSVQRR